MSFTDNKSFDVDTDTSSPDDSLLVSPTAAAGNNRSQRLGDIDDSIDNGNLKSNIGGMVHINNYNNQTTDQQQRDDTNFLEDSMLDESFQTLSGGGGETTPMRSKFRTSCASAMEELENFLAPTPCKSSSTNMDEKSSSRSEENNKKDCGLGTMDSLPVEEEKKQLFTLPEEEDSNLFGVEESTKTTDTTNNTHCNTATSAFRHPCIRQSSNESVSLELQMAHPVNSSNNNSSSFDSTSNSTDYYYESTHYTNTAKGSMLNDIDLSMEVEKGASVKSNKEVLVEESRINNIGMSTAVQTTRGAKEEAAMEDPAKQLGALKEEEEGNESHPENWGELDEGDTNDDQDDSLYDQSINDAYDPEQHVDESDQEDSTPGNGDDGRALGYLDSDSSDDDSDTEINKDYVNTMRDSISSYFSSRSDSSQVEEGNSLKNIAQYKTDVNEEDGNSNRLCDDACQIDVGDTLSYATNGIQSVQYQRYENVLGELKQKGIGSNNIKEDQINSNNNSNESQDLSVDENVHKNDCIKSKAVVKSKYFPEATFEETQPLQNDQFTFASSDVMVDDSFIQRHAPHTLLGNNSKQATAATLCDLANQSAVDGTDNSHAAKVNEEKSQFQSTSCEQQVGHRDLYWNDELENMLELKQSNPFDYDDDSVDAEQEVEAQGKKETTLQPTVHESTNIDTRRWSKESAPPTNIDNSSLSPICGDGSSPHNCELGSSDLSADSDNSLSNSSDTIDLKTEKSSIFQVLSQQPVQKQPSKELDDDQSLQGNTKQPDSNNESIDTQEVEQSIVHQEQQSDTPAPVDKKTLENSRQSLEDLSSYQQTFSSTSSAFLESLKGAAENRKREVSRVRQSMERKEQILEERISPPSMEAVEEEEETIIEPRKFETYLSMDDHSNRLNASSTSSSTSEFTSRPRAPHRSLSATHHKSSAADENPFIPFMAEPEVPDPRYSTAIGSKRKSNNAFKPHPAQNKSFIKSSASNVKPTKRHLSSQDSITKSSQEKRPSSTFKARPLPASTFIKPLLREQGKSIRSGKENGTAFVPSSEMRAQERSIYDANKKQREQQQRQDQIDRRNQVIQQTRSEIRELKEKLR